MLSEAMLVTTVAVTDLERAKRFFSEQLALPILDETPSEVTELRALVSEMARKLPAFLGKGVQLTTIVTDRDQQLRALLKDFKPGFGTFANILQGGRFRVNMWVAPGSVCDYGNPPKGLPRGTIRTLAVHYFCFA